eukprot:GHVT01064721.1.p1 GENE.GHVT01064721.1~~GHVT01064721.1.p1  ORF type:complete len:191 (+),score=37.85 GHVT01064721.1:566-1138(+)
MKTFGVICLQVLALASVIALATAAFFLFFSETPEESRAEMETKIKALKKKKAYLKRVTRLAQIVGSVLGVSTVAVKIAKAAKACPMPVEIADAVTTGALSASLASMWLVSRSADKASEKLKKAQNQLKKLDVARDLKMIEEADQQARATATTIPAAPVSDVAQTTTPAAPVSDVVSDVDPVIEENKTSRL